MSIKISHCDQPTFQFSWKLFYENYTNFSYYRLYNDIKLARYEPPRKNMIKI